MSSWKIGKSESSSNHNHSRHYALLDAAIAGTTSNFQINVADTANHLLSLLAPWRSLHAITRYHSSDHIPLPVCAGTCLH
jgi:hypothetical protein